jgi:type II secretory pathway component PulK
MTQERASSGFALLLVLWTLVILSAVALTFAASASTEVRASQDSWNDLQTERLAKSGHDFASYLETRMIGATNENLAGLPVQSIVAGLKYRVLLDGGTIDLIFEGENGKFDLLSANEAAAGSFWTMWTGDAERGQEIAAAIADWEDSDDTPRSYGAEAESYSGRGYSPRNGGLGSADLSLIKGISAEDLTPAVTELNGVPAIRQGLLSFISIVPTGNNVNVNYASPNLLRLLPNMTPEILAAILNMREQAIFKNAQDFRDRLGLSSDSALLNRIAFDRGATPAILSIARIGTSIRVRSERRVQMQIQRGRNQRDAIKVLAAIERDKPN